MEKKVTISGKEVTFKATALTPRLYRHKFGRDIMSDMKKLRDALTQKSKGKEFDALDLEVFENIAYAMAKQANPELPPTAEEWLDTFNMFSIYQVLPEILSLWGMNVKTTETSKKK